MSVLTDGVCFATREDVQKALDASETWRSNQQIDRQLEAESRNIEGALNRSFAPVLDTRYFAWPSGVPSPSWKLWLDENEVISLDLVTTADGATTLDPSSYFLEPANSGPPYNRLEMNLSGQATFDVGSTPQRNIALHGLFGFTDRSQLVGTTVGTITVDDDLVTIADGILAGVGSLLRCDSERVVTRERYFVSTTDTLGGNIDDSMSTTTVPYAGAVAIYPGELIYIDSEQMLVQSVVGSNLVVRRRWAGTVLASHTSGALIYAGRQFKVERGALGTSAAVHADGSTWTTWLVPGSVRELCIAETLNVFEQERSGYARTVGSGDYVRNAMGAGIADIRMRTMRAVGRQVRTIMAV